METELAFGQWSDRFVPDREPDGGEVVTDDLLVSDRMRAWPACRVASVSCAAGHVRAAAVGAARAIFHDVPVDADGHVPWGTHYRKPLPGIDAASLRFLSGAFAVDDRRVYYRTNTNLAVCASSNPYRRSR